MKKLKVCILILILYCSCSQKKIAPVFNANDLHEWNSILIRTVMEDLFPPIIAARVYTYPQIALYIAAWYGDTTMVPIHRNMNGLDMDSLIAPNKTYDYSIVMLNAWSFVASQLVFTEKNIETNRISFMELTKDLDPIIVKQSEEFGRAIGKLVSNWMMRDNYIQTRTLSRYTISSTDSTWTQTPPDYPNAIEPHWNLIRPILLTDLSMFTPVPPDVFSTDKSSEFYRLAREVYDSSMSLTEDQRATAWYWDDNPSGYQNKGHHTTFTHKITPGGHWLSIAGYACKQFNLDFKSCAAVYATLTIAQFDAFISCWDSKYKFNLIRPVTYINNYIDPKWSPLITTPGFPEYTSGHSCVTGASASILTNFFGDSFSFIDSTEAQFGLGSRKFNSFNDAANEASISRFYGGIHFQPALFIGLDQGNKIGLFVLDKTGMSGMNFNKE